MYCLYTLGGGCVYEYGGEGVIVAKPLPEATHGEALSEGNVSELLHKKSVAEIAGYLKHETFHAAALEGCA